MFREALTFDDVLLEPAESDVLPSRTDVSTFLTKGLPLRIPILSAAMDTVTESSMAVAMAQAGGMGVIHRNMSPELQAEEIRKVKRYESGVVVDPLTIRPDATLSQALALMTMHGISGVPVTEVDGTLVGLLTNRDVRFASDPSQSVRELMTGEGLVTVSETTGRGEMERLLHKHRIEKLLVVDPAYRCVGLVTVKDMEKARLHPDAVKDKRGRLMVAAATTVGDGGFRRTECLLEAGADVVVLDTAHGHSSEVIAAVARIKRSHADAWIVAGNVATADGTRALIDAGADAIKVGIGPGSICTTRMVAGVGIPQLTAVMDAAAAANGVPVIADGGIKYSGDLSKAMAGGASCVMIGSLLAGTEESPGDVFLYQGRRYKSYRGMGSIGAMACGSADRYSRESGSAEAGASFDDPVPEGVEGQVPFKGSVAQVLHQMIGGLRSAMGYTGSLTISEFHRRARFVRMTSASLAESHAHDVMITREAPNYPGFRRS